MGIVLFDRGQLIADVENLLMKLFSFLVGFVVSLWLAGEGIGQSDK